MYIKSYESQEAVWEKSEILIVGRGAKFDLNIGLELFDF